MMLYYGLGLCYIVGLVDTRAPIIGMLRVRYCCTRASMHLPDTVYDFGAMLTGKMLCTLVYHTYVGLAAC